MLREEGRFWPYIWEFLDTNHHSSSWLQLKIVERHNQTCFESIRLISAIRWWRSLSICTTSKLRIKQRKHLLSLGFNCLEPSPIRIESINPMDWKIAMLPDIFSSAIFFLEILYGNFSSADYYSPSGYHQALQFILTLFFKKYLSQVYLESLQHNIQPNWYNFLSAFLSQNNKIRTSWKKKCQRQIFSLF